MQSAVCRLNREHRFTPPGSITAAPEQPFRICSCTEWMAAQVEAEAMRAETRRSSAELAWEAARSDGLLLRYGSRPVDWYRINELKHSVSEERLEQVREIDGEQAYEKRRRASIGPPAMP